MCAACIYICIVVHIILQKHHAPTQIRDASMEPVLNGMFMGSAAK